MVARGVWRTACAAILMWTTCWKRWLLAPIRWPETWRILTSCQLCWWSKYVKSVNRSLRSAMTSFIAATLLPKGGTASYRSLGWWLSGWIPSWRCWLKLLPWRLVTWCTGRLTCSRRVNLHIVFICVQWRHWVEIQWWFTCYGVCRFRTCSFRFSQLTMCWWLHCWLSLWAAPKAMFMHSTIWAALQGVARLWKKDQWCEGLCSLQFAHVIPEDSLQDCLTTRTPSPFVHICRWCLIPHSRPATFNWWPRCWEHWLGIALWCVCACVNSRQLVMSIVSKWSFRRTPASCNCQACVYCQLLSSNITWHHMLWPCLRTGQSVLSRA